VSHRLLNPSTVPAAFPKSRQSFVVPALTRERPPFRSQVTRAFTLIELLVVLAIIAILASLLLPAVSRAKAAAHATECRNNLHTLGLAVQMYLGDFNAYPPTDGAGIMGMGQEYGWLMEDDWKMRLVPFIGVKDDRFVERAGIMRVLRCPQKVSNEDGKRGEGQFAMNASGTAPFKTSLDLGIGGSGEGWVRRPTGESQIRTPAELIAVGDILPGPSVVVAGTSKGPFKLQSLEWDGEKGPFVVKLDAGGNVLWGHKMAGQANDPNLSSYAPFLE